MQLDILSAMPPLDLGARANPLLAAKSEPVVNPSVISQAVVKRPIPKREIMDLRRIECAAAAVATLERDGCELFGLTKGQFSLTDMIEAILEKTGPADLSISTWTAAKSDVSRMLELLSSNAIRSCRWLVDMTFMRRCPRIYATSSLLRYSHTPSLAKTIQQSCSYNFISIISGVEITPTWAAA